MLPEAVALSHWEPPLLVETDTVKGKLLAATLMVTACGGGAGAPGA